jgi:hypothetical protein
MGFSLIPVGREWGQCFICLVHIIDSPIHVWTQLTAIFNNEALEYRKNFVVNNQVILPLFWKIHHCA